MSELFVFTYSTIHYQMGKIKNSSEILWVINLLQAKRQITHNFSQINNYSFVFQENIRHKEYERRLYVNDGASILIFYRIIQYMSSCY